jgi:hypothetical protein
MATVTKAHGGASPFEAVGRDIEWVHINVSTWVAGDFTTTPATVGSNLNTIVDAMSQMGTLTFQGVATANDMIFGIEGLGTAIDDIEVVLEALASVTAADATSVVITGATFG